MNSKIKYSAILITTLIIGVVIGFLLGGRITHHRIEMMRDFYTKKGFNREIMRIVEPTPEQRSKIIPILKKHAEQNRQLMINFHDGQKQLMDELKAELSDYLSKEQLDKLNNACKRKNRNFFNSRKNHSIKNKIKTTF